MLHKNMSSTLVTILGLLTLSSLISFGDVEAYSGLSSQKEGFRVAVPDTIEASIDKHVQYRNPIRRHNPKIKVRFFLETYKNSSALIFIYVFLETKPLASQSADTENQLLPPYYPTDTLFDEKYKPWGAASMPSIPPNQVILDKIDDELFEERSEIHSYDQMRHEETRNSLLL